MRAPAIPPSDEPPDFRRQAAGYSRYRRDYSDALYEAIEARAGSAAGRRALDVGCGTGLVSGTLARRGWRVTGVDFSAPMLAQARDALCGACPLVRARSEALPLAPSAVALVTCGTAFHWFDRLPALAAMRRAVVPGGWVALFWRYPRRGEPTTLVVRRVLERLGPKLPEEPATWHPPEPFAGSSLAPLPEVTIEVDLSYTVDGFHGYIATTELLRRLAGANHARFLAELREELEREYPDGLVERCREHLFLARRDGA